MTTDMLSSVQELLDTLYPGEEISVMLHRERQSGGHYHRRVKSPAAATGQLRGIGRLTSRAAPNPALAQNRTRPQQAAPRPPKQVYMCSQSDDWSMYKDIPMAGRMMSASTRSLCFTEIVPGDERSPVNELYGIMAEFDPVPSGYVVLLHHPANVAVP